jgi:hypothetical protein
MAEYLQAPPRRKALGLLADALTSGQEALNTVNLPYVGGLGGLLFGQAPQYLQDVSYGMPAFRGGNVATGGLGTLTPDTRMLDVATLPFVGAGAAKAGQVGAKTLGKEVARQVETGTGLIGSNVLDPRQYMFIGEKSKAWDTASNKAAKALEKEGVAPETIWSQTGNVKAPDGKWRQEIPDNTSTTGLLEKGKSYKLPEGLKHEELYKAYPELQNVGISLKAKPDNSSYFAPELNQIKIGTYSNESNIPSFIKNAMRQKEEDAVYAKAKELDAKKLLTPEVENKMSQELKDIDLKYANLNTNAFYPNQRMALHETQHAIQGLEGFAKGGSPSDMGTYLQVYQPEKYMSLIGSKDMGKMDEAQRDMYKRLAGEVESRLTENRLPLTREQRLQYYPYAQGQYGIDVPYNEIWMSEGLLK